MTRGGATGETGDVYNWPKLLRELRERRGWRQSDLSSLLHIRSNVTVSRWERGETVPDTRYSRALERLCLQHGLSWLFEQHRVGSVRLRLPWFHHAQFAGFYAASLTDIYEAAGLQVALEEGGFTSESNPIESVARGRSDFGVCRPLGLIKAVAQAPEQYPLKIVAVIFERTPLCQIVLPVVPSDKLSKSYWPMTTFNQLAKALMDHQIRLGRPEAQHRANLELKMALCLTSLKTGHHGINASLLHQSEHLIGGDEFADLDSRTRQVPVVQGALHDGALRKGYSLYSIPGYIFNEPHLLARAGFQEGRDFSLIHHDQELLELGVPMDGDVIFTSRRLIEQQPDLVRRFCRGSLLGWELVRRRVDNDIQTPLKWVHSFMKRTFRPFDEGHQSYMVGEVCRYLAKQKPLSKERTLTEEQRWQSMIVALEKSGTVESGSVLPEHVLWAASKGGELS